MESVHFECADMYAVASGKAMPDKHTFGITQRASFLDPHRRIASQSTSPRARAIPDQFAPLVPSSWPIGLVWRATGRNWWGAGVTRRRATTRSRLPALSLLHAKTACDDRTPPRPRSKMWLPHEHQQHSALNVLVVAVQWQYSDSAVAVQWQCSSRTLAVQQDTGNALAAQPQVVAECPGLAIHRRQPRGAPTPEPAPPGGVRDGTVRWRRGLRAFSTARHGPKTGSRSWPGARRASVRSRCVGEAFSRPAGPRPRHSRA